MGYRSEVVLVVDRHAVPSFMAMLAKNTEAYDLCFNDSDEATPDYGEKGSWFIRWGHIKWYDGYEDVSPIQSFVEAMEASDLSEYGEAEAPRVLDSNGKKNPQPGDWNEHFRFVRIGEDYGDIEVRGYAFDIHVNRAIDY